METNALLVYNCFLQCINCTLRNGNWIFFIFSFEFKLVLIVPCGMETWKDILGIHPPVKY